MSTLLACGSMVPGGILGTLMILALLAISAVIQFWPVIVLLLGIGIVCKLVSAIHPDDRVYQQRKMRSFRLSHRR